MNFSDDSSDNLEEPIPRPGRASQRNDFPASPANSKPRKKKPIFKKRNSFTPISNHEPANQTSSESKVNSESVWTEEEEDNLPYKVPFTTPYASRPNSPTRTTYPPRPALMLLLPSVFLALMYTFFKVVTTFWKSQPKNTKAA